MKRNRRSFSPDRHWGQTQVRLFVGGILILVIVGGGLVWLFYGQSAAVMTVACVLSVFGVIGLLWLILTLLERWVKDDEY